VNLELLGISDFLFTRYITIVDKEIIDGIEERKRTLEAARWLVNGVGEKGKGIDLNEYRLVEGGPKGLAWMNTPLN